MADAVRILTEIRDLLRQPQSVSNLSDLRGARAPSTSAVSSLSRPSSAGKKFRPVMRGSRKRYPPPAIINKPAKLPVPYHRPISHPPALSGGSNVPAIRNIFALARQPAQDQSQGFGLPALTGGSSVQAASGSALGPVGGGIGTSAAPWRQHVNMGGGGGMDCCKALLQKLDEIIAIMKQSSPEPDISSETGSVTNNLIMLNQSRVPRPRPPKLEGAKGLPRGLEAPLATLATELAIGAVAQMATAKFINSARAAPWRWGTRFRRWMDSLFK